MHELSRLAARRHGVLTRAQVVEQVGRRRLDRLQRSGVVERVRPGVYRIAGSAPTWHQAVRAMVDAAGQGAVASWRTAARLHGLDEHEPDVLEVTTSRQVRVRLAGVVAHQTRVLPTTHVTTVQGIPVTSVARTLWDLTAIRPRWAVEQAVDRALRAEQTTWPQLVATFTALAQPGRRRSTMMRAILDARDPSVGTGESPMEAKVARLLVRAGLPAPVHQHVVRVDGHRHRLDLAYPDAHLAIEYDGWDAHRGRSAFDRDRIRQNRLILSGWRILRFTSAMTDDQIVTEVRSALDHHRAADRSA